MARSARARHGKVAQRANAGSCRRTPDFEAYEIHAGATRIEWAGAFPGGTAEPLREALDMGAVYQVLRLSGVS